MRSDVDVIEQVTATHVVADENFSNGPIGGEDDDDDTDATISPIIVQLICDEDVAVSAGLAWVGRSAACSHFVATCDHHAVPEFLQRFLSDQPAGTEKMMPTPWSRLGYYRAAAPHMLKSVAEQGFDIGAAPEQFQFSFRSVVYRIPTAKGYLFYKATAVESDEVARTNAVVQHFPEHTPHIMCTIPRLHATLTLDFGQTLSKLCFVPQIKQPAAGYEDRADVAAHILRQWARIQKKSATLAGHSRQVTFRSKTGHGWKKD